MYVPEELESNINIGRNGKLNRKAKIKLSINGEMTVQWKVTGGKDKENHKFEAGAAQFRFFLDQCQI